MSKRSVRIALFLCDTPNPLVLEAHGTYLPIFTSLLADSLCNAGLQNAVNFRVDAFDVVQGKLPDRSRFVEGGEDAFDAILMTGSAACSFDDEKHPWVPPILSLLRDVGDNEAHVRIIGICFGLQLLARAYGGEVARNPKGWEIGTYTITCTAEGERLFATKSLEIQQMHADHVVGLPKAGSWDLLASTEKSIVHALASRYPDGKVHFLAIQGHPEFTPSIVGKMIDVRSSSGVFTPEMTVEARRRCALPDEGRTTFGRTMWQVILGEI